MTTTLIAPKVGDILVSSWGYDQTNIDFYKVIGLTAKSVKIVKIGQQIHEQTGWLQETVLPDPDIVLSEPITRRVGIASDGYSVKVRDYAWAYLWDGRPKHQSHYA
jgi:hypothetical protein